MGPTWGLTGPRWAPCWPHEPCYLGTCVNSVLYLNYSNRMCCLHHQNPFVPTETFVNLENPICSHSMWCRYHLVLSVFFLAPGVDLNNGHGFVTTSRRGQNGRHFSDDIFKCVFLNVNLWISSKIPLKFVPESPINNILALVQIIAWRWSGNKPLSDPMNDG